MGRTIRWNWRASKELEPASRLWLLRIVVELGADGGLFDADSIGDAHVAGLLGLEVSGKHRDRATARQQLQSLLSACENDQAARRLPPCRRLCTIAANRVVAAVIAYRTAKPIVR